MNGKLIEGGIVLTKVIIAVIIGILEGNGAVYFFNKMPGTWLCDYGETPSDELLNPTTQRIKSSPWKYLFSMGFVILNIKLVMDDWQYAIAASAVLLILLELSLADKKYSIVPDQLVILLCITAIGFIPFHGSWKAQLFGGLIGFGLMTAIALVGKFAYKRESIGGGDIKSYTIRKADIHPTVTLEGWTYGENANEPSVDGNPGEGEVTYTYAEKDGTEYSETVPTEAGEYTVKATVAETDNYKGGEAEADFTIAKADAVPAAISANHRIYDGTENPLVTVTGEAEGGEMQYALGTATEVTGEYGSAIPTAADIGTYYVWYRVVGDDNHESTDELGPVEVNLDPEHEFGTPDFTLPEQLDVLDESAFEGVPSLKVVDAHSCTSIGRDVFKGTGLKQIRLPKDCEIDAEAFGGQTVCVYAPAGGTTEAFCADDDNLVFVAEAE